MAESLGKCLGVLTPNGLPVALAPRHSQREREERREKIVPPIRRDRLGGLRARSLRASPKSPARISRRSGPRLTWTLPPHRCCRSLWRPRQEKTYPSLLELMEGGYLPANTTIQACEIRSVGRVSTAAQTFFTRRRLQKVWIVSFRCVTTTKVWLLRRGFMAKFEGKIGETFPPTKGTAATASSTLLSLLAHSVLAAPP